MGWAFQGGLEWQARLGAVQRLNLALLVDATDHGVLGWCQVHADHVGQFLRKRGSRERLNVLVRWGFRPWSCQAR